MQISLIVPLQIHAFRDVMLLTCHNFWKITPSTSQEVLYI